MGYAVPMMSPFHSLPYSRMQISSRIQAVFLSSRSAILAATVAGFVAWSTALHAQSSDPGQLRQIIDEINAKAAADTWGYKTTAASASPTPANPGSSSPQPSSASNSGHSGLSNSGASDPGPSGFASLASGNTTDSSSDSTASIAPSTAPVRDTPGSAQPASQDVAAPSTSQDSSTQPVVPDAPTLPTTKARPATVTYDAGMLTVLADDSSLNLILRKISRLTGIIITGGVADQRVFGNYGPAKPSTILSKLLDGSGVNVVLRGGPHATITELILAPLGKGAVPPSPDSAVWGPDDPKDSGK